MKQKQRTFFVECYSPGIDRESVKADGARASSVAAGMRRDGVAIRYLHAMFMSADEVVFHVFIADDARSVDEASRRAGVRFERIVESIALSPRRGAAATSPPERGDGA
jgi:hypothetical protein